MEPLDLSSLPKAPKGSHFTIEGLSHISKIAWLSSAFGFGLLVIGAAGSHVARAQTAADLVAQADRLAWLKNWARAEPLFSRAEQMFLAAGDQRNALYARIGALRGRLPQLPLIDVSQRLSADLDNSIVQNDPKLKLRC